MTVLDSYEMIWHILAEHIGCFFLISPQSRRSAQFVKLKKKTDINFSLLHDKIPSKKNVKQALTSSQH
jgi:hypothetical protein